MKPIINIESRLALEILSESKISKHQRRYEAVQRYIKTFGLLPHYSQILRELPKEEYLIEQVIAPDIIAEEITLLEEQLQANPNDSGIINALDKLYDESYRLNISN